MKHNAALNIMKDCHLRHGAPCIVAIPLKHPDLVIHWLTLGSVLTDEGVFIRVR